MKKLLFTFILSATLTFARGGFGGGFHGTPVYGTPVHMSPATPERHTITHPIRIVNVAPVEGTQVIVGIPYYPYYSFVNFYPMYGSYWLNYGYVNYNLMSNNSCQKEKLKDENGTSHQLLICKQSDGTIKIITPDGVIK